MTKRDIKSIILYLDSAEAIEYLTNEQTGILFKAVFRYARTGQKLESSDTALTASPDGDKVKFVIADYFAVEVCINMAV